MKKFEIYKILSSMDLVSKNKLITNYIFEEMISSINIIYWDNIYVRSSCKTHYNETKENTTLQKGFFNKVIRIIELNIYV